MPHTWGSALELARRVGAKVNPLVLLAPVIFTLGMAYFVAMGEFPYQKKELEAFPFFVLVPFTALAFVRFCAERRPFFLWLTLLLGAVLCREIHFPGTTVGVMVAIFGLFAVVVFRYDELQDGFDSPLFVNLLVAGFTSYFISEFMLDHNWARIPRHFKQEYLFRSMLEEVVENFGHFLLAISAAMVPVAHAGADAGSARDRER